MRRSARLLALLCCLCAFPGFAPAAGVSFEWPVSRSKHSNVALESAFSHEQGRTASASPAGLSATEAAMNEKTDSAFTGGRPLRPLTPEESRIIEQKGTEPPFSGIYTDHFENGDYRCRRCDAPLYPSSAKFHSRCGWPSFDEAFPGAVREAPDADGRRTEILCAACGGHLGHVFRGEGFTDKNVRHCVNSLSLTFAAQQEAAAQAVETAVFAGGCFWGVEHLLRGQTGVLEVVSGYTGGHTPEPTYAEVCSGSSGHAEAVRVTFDPARTDFESLCRFFFEIHDPTQLNRQGPDIGTQYRSAVFYTHEGQRLIALRLIEELRALGYAVVTELAPAGPFYEAEESHQRFLEKHPERSCHTPVKRFER